MAKSRSKKSSGTKKASKKSSTKKTTKKGTKYKSLTSYTKTKKTSSKSTTKKTTSQKSSTKKSAKKKKAWQAGTNLKMKDMKKKLAKKQPKKIVTVKNNNRWHAKGKKVGILVVVKEQSGRTHKKRDAARQALPPGWRISSRGTIYFENRKNRSDLDGLI